MGIALTNLPTTVRLAYWTFVRVALI